MSTSLDIIQTGQNLVFFKCQQKSLDDRDSPVLDWMRVPTTSGTSASLLEQWGEVINKPPRKRGVVSLGRTIRVLFIGLVAWLRRHHFKLGSAGEFKAFKCLALRKEIVSLENAQEVIWTSEKEIISLVNARENILTLKNGTIPLVTRKKWLAAGTERHSITASARLILIFQLSLKEVT